MRKFFLPNLDWRGRLVRGVGGALFLASGIMIWGFNAWVALGLILFGGFMLFEAVRGWCLVRACGIRTKL